MYPHKNDNVNYHSGIPDRNSVTAYNNVGENWENSEFTNSIDLYSFSEGSENKLHIYPRLQIPSVFSVMGYFCA